MEEMEKSRKISFHFHPYNWENRGHAVEKADDSGSRRKYLCGVASGPKVDGHGERMTEKAIESFMDQANSGDLLLYPDIHGIKASEDIGILDTAKVLDDGDWYTEFRLYDEHDGIGPNKLEKIETLWKQQNGLPPYTTPKQKGFSVEGSIPESSIISRGGSGRGVIHDVLLDGVVLVPRPAYKDSIATAIYKALGETSPFRKESIQGILRDKVEQQEVAEQYHSLKWDYMDALDDMIQSIMVKKNNIKKEELEIAFDEYKELMINLILQSEKVFQNEPEDTLQMVKDTYGRTPVEGKRSKVTVLKDLLLDLNQLTKIMEEKKHE